jgi:hypothetical protein
MHMSRRLVSIAVSVAAITGVALMSCQSPRAQANTAEELVNLGNGLNNTQQDLSVLQESIDSLRQVVARQDTTINRLAAIAGLQQPSR